MIFGGRKATALLFIGDIAVFVFSLWLTLWARFGYPPSADTFLDHLSVFAILFFVWAAVFYMAGLYSKRAVLSRNELSASIFRTQILNIVLAALFFFFVPYFGITPKTILAIYLVISLALIFFWRLWLFPRVTKPATRERAALVGTGPEVDDLVREVNGNPRYRLEFAVVIDPRIASADFGGFSKELRDKKVSILVINAENEAIRPLLPRIYDEAFVHRRYQCSDLHDVYEEVFDRAPLSLLQHEWFLRNLSDGTSGFYAFLKRVIDIVGGLAMCIVTAIITPLVFIAMRLEGPGPIFISQERLGQYGTRMRAYKFRSMRFNDAASGSWVGEGENAITRVGSFLRLTSLDEFPQFINVLRGDLSLVGPRNDIEGLGMRLAEAIPYYNVRYIVKPGITGWAQINQQYEQGGISPQSIEETKVRLAYDFYYVKNRSVALDIVIALKTIKRMFFRVSSW